jgi:hypothetical protein
VLAGNPANVGHEGFPGVTVTNLSAAVVLRQWTGANTGGPTMRAIGATAWGWVSTTGGGAISVQDTIMARDPGALIIEIIGSKDLGNDNDIFLDLPNANGTCPVGTALLGGVEFICGGIS